MLENLLKYYEEEYREDERLKKDKAHAVEFMTSLRYFDKTFPKGGRVLDACAGTGVYSFYLAKQGYQVTAGDLVEHNVCIMKEKQLQEPILSEIYSGSVLDLSRFEDNSFDVVLCMGALYHLRESAERERAVQECLRVLKPGGVFAAAYINKYAVILYSHEEQLSNIDELLEYNEHGHKGIFCGSTPEEMCKLMSKVGLKTLYHIGTDGIAYLISSKINASDEEHFNKWLRLHFDTCEKESLLGYSLHGLYLGMKV